MKNISIMLFAAVAAFAAIAEKTEPVRKAYKDMTPEEQAQHRKFVAEKRLQMTGGEVVKPGTGLGSIAIIDTQKRFTEAASVAATIGTATKLNVVASTAKAGSVDDPAAALEASKADLAVFVVDNEKSPAMLIAPEDRWAVVNVAKLEVGLKGPLAGRMFTQRCRKELIRAFSLLCGGGASQFPGNIMDVSKVENLDLAEEFFPIDMATRYATYLKELNVTPRVLVAYSRACHEGWAPQPTNDIQKAVWDRVHQLPTEPIKILPESKRKK